MYIARGMLTDFPWKNDYYLSDWLGGEAQVLDAMIGRGGPVDRLWIGPWMLERILDFKK